MTIVVLGAGGQLANDLCRSLAGYSIVALGRTELDILDHRATADQLRALRPSVVVNTAAYNRVDDAEEQVDLAFAINAFAVRHIARLCAELRCRLVHFSTDYVFGRAQTVEAWTELDLPAPLCVYGASKLCGEHFVRAYCDRHLIIRTSGLFGFRRSGKASNFVEAILRTAERTGQVRVVNDQIVGPSYTADVADATARLIATGANGTFHITSAGRCTWYEFAVEILRQAGRRAVCTPITSAEYGAKAARPPVSVLSNARLMAAGIAQPPRWQDGLARYLTRRASPANSEP